MQLVGETVEFPFFGPFTEDGRADRVEAHKVTQRNGTPANWLYLLGPAAAATHVELCGGCGATPVQESERKDFSHRLEFPRGIPDDIRELAQLLEEVLSLRTRQYVDAAIALDWYTIPEDGVDPNRWKRTTMGEAQYQSKWRNTRSAKQTLIAGMLDAIDRHPLLRDTPTVVTVPGHEGNGKSFGERLARHLARETGKAVINTTSNGPHEESKSGSTHEYGDFTITEQLDGDVLIIDDVYRSGMSMSVAAHAARQAGAERVFGLVVARTLRN